MSAIFISYRRVGALVHARALFERLRNEFGPNEVFIDLEGIDYGIDFVDVLNEQLTGCQVMLALIDPQWASATDRQGRRRIDREHDFVRTEIVTALSRGIRTVPVLIDGAEMPDPEDLPESLRPLTRRNALVLDFNRFDAEIARLIGAIRRIITISPAAVPSVRDKPLGPRSPAADDSNPSRFNPSVNGGPTISEAQREASRAAKIARETQAREMLERQKLAQQRALEAEEARRHEAERTSRLKKQAEDDAKAAEATRAAQAEKDRVALQKEGLERQRALEDKQNESPEPRIDFHTREAPGLPAVEEKAVETTKPVRLMSGRTVIPYCIFVLLTFIALMTRHLVVKESQGDWVFFAAYKLINGLWTGGIIGLASVACLGPRKAGTGRVRVAIVEVMCWSLVFFLMSALTHWNIVMPLFNIKEVASPELSHATLTLACLAALVLGAIVGWIEALIREPNSASAIRGAILSGTTFAVAILSISVGGNMDFAGNTLDSALFAYGSNDLPIPECLIFALVFGLRVIGFRGFRFRESTLRLAKFVWSSARSSGA